MKRQAHWGLELKCSHKTHQHTPQHRHTHQHTPQHRHTHLNTDTHTNTHLNTDTHVNTHRVSMKTFTDHWVFAHQLSISYRKRFSLSVCVYMCVCVCFTERCYCNRQTNRDYFLSATERRYTTFGGDNYVVLTGSSPSTYYLLTIYNVAHNRIT